MKIGVMASSGGAVFREVYNILKDCPDEVYEFYVITDRECGIEDICIEYNINYMRIENCSNILFSNKTKSIFDNNSVDYILLFLSRLITNEIFLNYPTFNIHPSLLPSFIGFNSIDSALKSRVKFFGATLHLVDNTIDRGSIIGQVCMPIKADYTKEQLYKYSFIQKVYLSLLLVDLFKSRSIKLINNNSDFKICKELYNTDRCNPCISDQYFLKCIMKLQERENVEVI